MAMAVKKSVGAGVVGVVTDDLTVIVDASGFGSSSSQRIA
jgi:hypothetical protein